MTESETEDETLERLEAALRRIASAAAGPRRIASDGPGIDREALSQSLDLLIARLRAGLKPAMSAPQSTE
jgi:hypothetical protein